MLLAAVAWLLFAKKSNARLAKTAKNKKKYGRKS
jgi:hypothetical protein